LIEFVGSTASGGLEVHGRHRASGFDTVTSALDLIHALLNSSNLAVWL
jgi:hypothetical protein